MKTMRIAGTPLELHCHNVVGNDKRDGLRNVKIGQSAAELGIVKKVQRSSRKGVASSEAKYMESRSYLDCDMI